MFSAVIERVTLFMEINSILWGDSARCVSHQRSLLWWRCVPRASLESVADEASAPPIEELRYKAAVANDEEVVSAFEVYGLLIRLIEPR